MGFLEEEELWALLHSASQILTHTGPGAPQQCASFLVFPLNEGMNYQEHKCKEAAEGGVGVGEGGNGAPSSLLWILQG